MTFEVLKKYLIHTLTLAKPFESEELELYLVVLEAVVNVALLISEGMPNFPSIKLAMHLLELNPAT